MMTAMIKKTTILTVIVLAICVSGVWAANEFIYVRKPREVLTDLKCVKVTIEYLSLDAKEAGLTREQIRTDVELKLRLAGIKVLSEEESILRLSPILYVNIAVIKSKDLPTNIFAVNIEVSLRESVFLVRNPKIITYAATWNEGSIHILGRNKVQEGVQKGVKDKVDRFINDYLAANPKEPVVEKKPTSNKKGEIISTEELMKEIQDNK